MRKQNLFLIILVVFAMLVPSALMAQSSGGSLGNSGGGSNWNNGRDNNSTVILPPISEVVNGLKQNTWLNEEVNPSAGTFIQRVDSIYFDQAMRYQMLYRDDGLVVKEEGDATVERQGNGFILRFRSYRRNRVFKINLDLDGQFTLAGGSWGRTATFILDMFPDKYIGWVKLRGGINIDEDEEGTPLDISFLYDRKSFVTPGIFSNEKTTVEGRRGLQYAFGAIEREIENDDYVWIYAKQDSEYEWLYTIVSVALTDGTRFNFKVR